MSFPREAAAAAAAAPEAPQQQQQLPQSQPQLFSGAVHYAEVHQDVTILFADIVGFTTISGQVGGMHA